MESYSQQMRTQPVPLYCFMGESPIHEKLIAALRETNLRKGGEGDSFKYMTISDVSMDKITEFFPQKKYVMNASEAKLRESRIPSGLLKSSWLLKQQSKVPSVIVASFFIDVRLPIVEWGAREGYIHEAVRLLRSLNGQFGYYSKFVVVLIQRKCNASGEDLKKVTEERITSLKRRVEVESKQLLFMNEADILQSSVPITRLVAMCTEHSIEYYNDVIKHVKRHRRYLNKGSQLGLQIRHAIKTAHYYEFKKDQVKSLQYYKSAYGYITDLESALALGDNSYGNFAAQEVRAVGDFVNFKLCLYAVQHSETLKDAVAQFRSHITVFRNYVGDPDRSWKHYEWVSKQYRFFAELLEQVIKNNRWDPAKLPPYQQPVMYFHQAALQAIKRREIAQVSGLYDAPVPDTFDPSETVLRASNFLGGKPTVVTLGSGIAGGNDYLLLQHERRMESKVKHSEEILYLLDQTYRRISSRKGSSSSSFQLYIACLMGEEYFFHHQYLELEALLKNILINYTDSKWQVIVSSILSRLVVATKQLGKLEDYIGYSLHLLSPTVPVTGAEKDEFGYIKTSNLSSRLDKVSVYRDLFAAVSDPAAFVDAKKAWGDAKVLATPMVYQLDALKPLLKCCYHFHSHEANISDKVPLTLKITSHFPLNIKFSKIVVEFNNVDYSCVVDSEPTDSVEKEIVAPKLGHPSSSTAFTIGSVTADDIQSPTVGGGVTLVPRAEKVVNVTLDLRHSNISLIPQTVKFHVTVPNGNSNGPDIVLCVPCEPITFRAREGNYGATLKVLRPQSLMKMSFIHDAPNLVGEYQKLVCKIDSSEDEMKNIEVRFLSNPPLTNPREAFLFTRDEKSERGYVAMPLDEDNQPYSHITVPNLKPGQQSEVEVYLKFLKPDKRIVVVVTDYDTAREVRVAHKSEVTIASELPFKPSFLFRSRVPHPLPISGILNSYAVTYQQPIIITTELTCTTKIPLKIFEIKYVPTAAAKCLSLENDSLLSDNAGTVIAPDDSYTVCTVVTPHEIGSDIVLVKLMVKWCRLGLNEQVTSVCSAPSLIVEQPPITIMLDFPPQVIVGVPFRCTLILTNHTTNMQELLLLAESLDQRFLFHGMQNAQVRLLPFEVYRVPYTVVATQCGFQHLPTINVSSVRWNKPLLHPYDNYEIFVSPSNN